MRPQASNYSETREYNFSIYCTFPAFSICMRRDKHRVCTGVVLVVFSSCSFLGKQAVLSVLCLPGCETQNPDLLVAAGASSQPPAANASCDITHHRWDFLLLRLLLLTLFSSVIPRRRAHCGRNRIPLHTSCPKFQIFGLVAFSRIINLPRCASSTATPQLKRRILPEPQIST